MSTTKEITGTVTETVIVSKTVTVMVPVEADADEMKAAVRESAYQKMCGDGTGWEIEGSQGADVELENACPDCGQPMVTKMVPDVVGSGLSEMKVCENCDEDDGE